MSLMFMAQCALWKIHKYSFFFYNYSIEQFQHMHGAMQQQLGSSVTTIRRRKSSVGSQEGGRIFNDAIAWISQQKVSTTFIRDI